MAVISGKPNEVSVFDTMRALALMGKAVKGVVV